jgi:hypothetical protein
LVVLHSVSNLRARCSLTCCLAVLSSCWEAARHPLWQRCSLSQRQYAEMARSEGMLECSDDIRWLSACSCRSCLYLPVIICVFLPLYLLSQLPGRIAFLYRLSMRLPVLLPPAACCADLLTDMMTVPLPGPVPRGYISAIEGPPLPKGHLPPCEPARPLACCCESAAWPAVLWRVETGGVRASSGSCSPLQLRQDSWQWRHLRSAMSVTRPPRCPACSLSLGADLDASGACIARSLSLAAALHASGACSPQHDRRLARAARPRGRALQGPTGARASRQEPPGTGPGQGPGPGSGWSGRLRPRSGARGPTRWPRARPRCL